METLFIELDGLKIEHRRNRKQKFIRLQVKENGKVILSTNKSTGSTEIRNWLLDKQEWIKKQQRNFYLNSLKIPKPQFKSGDTYFFRGRPLFFVKILKDSERVIWSQDGVHLFCECNEKKTIHQLQISLRAFYRLKGENYLIDRTQMIAKKFRFNFKRILIKDYKARWGACSSDKTISLNWKLIAAPESVIDSVIIHELCHLTHMNHSKSFWEKVESLDPHFITSKKWLRENHQVFAFLEKHKEFSP